MNDLIVGNMDLFVCLGHVVTANDCDWPMVCCNLVKAWKRWAMFSCLLCQQGATLKVSGMFHKAVVMSALLCACKTWIVDSSIVKGKTLFQVFDQSL